MRPITVDALLGELDRALVRLRDAAPVVAFDADGTLWTGDVGDDFFESLVAAGAVRSEATAAFALAVAALGPTSDAPADCAKALLAGVHDGRFEEERFYELVGWLGAGHTRSELAAFVDAMFVARALDSRLHPEVKPVFAWARERALEIFVVSASPRIVVERGVSRFGVDPEHVLAAEAEFDGDRMAARPRRPIPYGPGKVSALRSKIGSRPLLAAFGDNVFDLAMLRESAVPVAVRPKDRLLARADEVPGCYRI